ncbi:MAG: M1 family metallopeptidase [Bacteroidia bacterium]|nr:M1 family metallopeptidase [Bacteroidia bacterium]
MIRKTLPVALLTLWIIFPRPVAAKDGYPRNPDVDVTHYCFRIFLNDSTDRIEGSAEITFTLARKMKFLALDLVGLNNKGTGMVIDRIDAGTQKLTWRHENNRVEIEIPDSIRAPGSFSLTVNYSGIPADGLIISKNKFGDRTFFGDNWPDRARNWLPCVDHPYDKATVEFIVAAPEKYTVVGNGYLAGEYPETGTLPVRRKVTHWKEDVPVPTKVMVFGAADFAWETAGLSKGISVQSWVYARNREAGFTDYKAAADILTFYQDLIGPYSYEKLANVQSRTMFGGMENSGCIFYYEGSVTGKNNIQGLLAHEIAHQWFGDAVTENDWHHIWLSEGFATYLEAYYADSMIVDRNMSTSMADMRKDVIRYYERKNKPVIDTTITNYMDLLSTNSYQKGAWVLHMLRQELGDKIFWAGIRNFYASYRDKNAMTADFVKIMEDVSGRPLEKFFHQWLEIPGQPVIKWSWKNNTEKRQVELDIEQMQTQADFIFFLPVEIGMAASAADPTAWKSVFYQVPVQEKKVHIILPADFPVSQVRLDPQVQLLFQDYTAKK